MKGTILFALAAVLAVGLNSIANASIIAQESFAYTNGSLANLTGGSGWASNWTESGMNVLNQAAVTNSIANPPKYGSRGFNVPSTSVNFFAKLRFRASNLGLTNYFGVSFTIGANNNIMTFGKSPNVSTFQCGNSGLSASLIPVLNNENYALIGAYNNRMSPNPDQILLWINPDTDDFFNPITGANSADIVHTEPIFFNPASITMYSDVAGTLFDELILSDDSESVGLRSVSTQKVVPSSFTITAGSLFGGSVASLLSSDNNKVFILNDDSAANALIEIEGSRAVQPTSSARVKYEVAATRTDLSVLVDTYVYGSLNSFVNRDFSVSTVADTVREFMLSGSAVSNFVSGTGNVRVRLRWVPQADLEAADGWSESIDQVSWTLE